MEKKLTVTKPNPIAEARGIMNKSFLDILDISLQKVASDMENPNQLKYTINVKDYQDKFGLKFDRNSFMKLRISAKSAMRSNSLITVEIEPGREVDFFVFQEIEYVEKEGVINVMFTERFKGMLVDLLKRRGLKIYYSLPDTLQMNSEYSKKLYPVLLERVHKGGNGMTFSAYGTLHDRTFDSIFPIDDFKKLLGIPKSYKTSNVKSTCSLIMGEIERCTPYHATVAYNEQKALRGRPKTTHVCWTMEPKETPKQENKGLESMKLTIEETAKKAGFSLNEKEVAAVSRAAVASGLNDAEIKRRILHIGKNTGYIKNQVGYLIFVLSERYEKEKEKIKNGFHNFEQRDTDYDALMWKLAQEWMK